LADPWHLQGVDVWVVWCSGWISSGQAGTIGGARSSVLVESLWEVVEALHLWCLGLKWHDEGMMGFGLVFDGGVAHVP